jgi:hypothetical protein
MTPEAIANLVRKGTMAGQAIVRTFDGTQWQRHRFTRYLTMMQQLQASLQRAGQRFEEFGPFLSEGASGVDVYRRCHDTAWCHRAAGATEELLSVAAPWGGSGRVDFFMDRECPQNPDACPGCEPQPIPSLRIMPNV